MLRGVRGEGGGEGGGKDEVKFMSLFEGKEGKNGNLSVDEALGQRIVDLRRRTMGGREREGVEREGVEREGGEREGGRDGEVVDINVGE